MKERRYAKYYRLAEDGGNGVSYAGDWYRFPDGTPEPRRRALRLAAPLAAYWLCAAIYLTTASATDRYMPALVPFLLGLFPGVYGMMGLAAFARAPGRMTILQREKGPGRVVRSALGCGVFSAIATIGAAVCLTRAASWNDAWTEPALTALCAAAGFAAFARARRDYNAMMPEE